MRCGMDLGGVDTLGSVETLGSVDTLGSGSRGDRGGAGVSSNTRRVGVAFWGGCVIKHKTCRSGLLEAART